MQHITAIRYVFTISVNHNPTTAMMKWDAYDFDLELADCFVLKMMSKKEVKLV